MSVVEQRVSTARTTRTWQEPTAPGAALHLPDRSAGAVLMAYLTEQIERLRTSQALIRQGDPEAVHQMRLAIRRLRCTLATFRRYFDPDVTEPLRDDLGRLGRALASARDLDAVREHLRAAVAAEPAELVLGPVLARIVTGLGTRFHAERDTVVQELDGQRYRDLQQSLDHLVMTPPLSRWARRPATKALPRQVARSWKRARRLHRRIVTQPGPQPRDEQWHQLRKAARRARYAAEVAEPVAGRPARTFATRMKAIQSALGAHQDTVVVRTRLRELGVAAHLDGENGFTYGRLHALEQARAEHTLRQLRRAWDDADRRAVRRWTRR
jgi:CHAD domain-containing protein